MRIELKSALEQDYIVEVVLDIKEHRPSFHSVRARCCFTVLWGKLARRRRLGKWGIDRTCAGVWNAEPGRSPIKSGKALFPDLAAQTNGWKQEASSRGRAFGST